MNNLQKIMQALRETFEGVKSHTLATIVALMTVMGFVYMTINYPPGWISYLATLPALLVISITALARVNDITPLRRQWNWQIRRLALVLTGSAAVTIMAGPLAEIPRYPSWVGSMLTWGFALAWLTTPGMPPWWKYIVENKETGNGRRKQSAD